MQLDLRRLATADLPARVELGEDVPPPLRDMRLHGASLLRTSTKEITRLKALFVVLVTLIAGTAAAAAPGDPWRSTAWARGWVRSTDHVSHVNCYGLAPSRRGLFQTFRCAYAFDGEHWKSIIHSSGDESWVENTLRRPRVIASRSADGDFASAIAGGSEDRPGWVEFRVRVHPNQPVLVEWNLTCARGLSAGSRSGHATVYDLEDLTPGTLPETGATQPPDNCVFAADASLDNGGGRLQVQIVDTAY